MACFSKESRLLKPIDFNHLRQGARCANAPFLRFYYKDSRLNCESARLGISVSKKVGNAVQRNRVKRILREAFKESGIRNRSLDILVVASPRLKRGWQNLDQNTEDIRKSWEIGIKRLKKDD